MVATRNVIASDKRSVDGNTAICLKPINSLLAESFWVPSYQRGYRWTERQVRDLLNDLWEFQSASERMEKESFYCLQPIVVKKRTNGAWELVDGQQRLTTIFLILSCLKPILSVLNKDMFTLVFETRSETSGAFLKNIDLAQRDNNVDYYHICNAYIAIKEWFTTKDGPHQVKFLQCLLSDDDLGRNVKVIWYQLPDTENPVEAFTRLNVGKIPLTNAELIRALFLRSGNFEQATKHLQQLKIAQEWDGIEKTLQRDDVWSFLHSGINPPPSRIEYIFQLIRRQNESKAGLVHDPYSTFHFFNEKFNKDVGFDTDAEWLHIKRFFLSFEEWFNDRELYHLIGFLICNGDDLLEIHRAAQTVNKRGFKHILKARIFKRLFGIDLHGNEDFPDRYAIILNAVGDLEYGASSDALKIRSILLLFNIATILQNPVSNLRFPFNNFKREDWDIEHIRSVESGRPARPEVQRRWLENVQRYLNESAANEELARRINALLGADKLNDEQFDVLYTEILLYFHEQHHAEADDGVGNLTLLDAATNRSYKNAVFPVKRQRVLALDREGTFVPLCTRNVFLKCYSKQINNMMFWSEEDSKSYCEAIVQTLVIFFQLETGA